MNMSKKRFYELLEVHVKQLVQEQKELKKQQDDLEHDRIRNEILKP